MKSAALILVALALFSSVAAAQTPSLTISIPGAVDLGGGALQIDAGLDWRLVFACNKPLVRVQTWAIFHQIDGIDIPWIFVPLRDDAIPTNTIITQYFSLPNSGVDVNIRIASLGTYLDGTQMVLTRDLLIRAGTGDL